MKSYKGLILATFFYRWFKWIFQFDLWLNRSWSQEGEDLVLKRIFEGQSEGFYVDIGAHHPKRFSNTYLFYKMGWHGINIDAMPGSMLAFKRMRKRDINIEVGVGEKVSVMDYYMFNDPALNGFSSELSKYREQTFSNYKVEKILKVPVVTLNSILKKHCSNRKIDFMSVDAEGFDLSVLRSNDWDQYRPKYLIVEIIDADLSNLHSTGIGEFLKEKGYVVYAKLVHSVIYYDESEKHKNGSH